MMLIMLDPSPEIVEGIIGKLKTNGMFDQMRRSCLADIDTKVHFFLQYSSSLSCSFQALW